MASTRRKTKWLVVFILSISTFAVCMVLSYTQKVQVVHLRDLHPFTMIPDPIIGKPCDVQTMPDGLMSEDSHPSRILYLLQTEECLPSHLRLALGESSLCQCDVAVLSFVNACNDTSLPHVSYIFEPNTTWTTGRNLLYYTYVYNKSERYLYYILMDDDIEVMWRERWKVMLGNKDPWRSFEAFIRKTQPPIAALELHETLLSHIEEIRASRDCCMDKEYTITVRYDAAFNAFHYQAIDYVLPYWDELDNVSWWNSQLYVIAWSEIVFRGQVLLHRQLMAYNPVHHPYPRSDDFDSPLPVMIDNMRERVPAECQNALVLADIVRNGFDHLHTTSSSYCLPPPPPRQSIIPFKNLAC